MAWEPRIRPVGRPKITEDDNLGFQRIARRFVVEGPKVCIDGLSGDLDGSALFLPVGTPDVEFKCHYLIHQYIEPTTSQDKAVLVREFAELRDTWTKESMVETGELKKLTRSYAVLRQDNSILHAMDTPCVPDESDPSMSESESESEESEPEGCLSKLGYDTEQFDLMPKSGQVCPDSNDPWDLLPCVIQCTEPVDVSYADLVESPIADEDVEHDTTLRIVWSRQVVVTDVSAGNVQLEVTGAIPYRLGEQPASGEITYLEANAGVSVELGAQFSIIVDPRVTPTRAVDLPITYSESENDLYSTHSDSVGEAARYENIELNNLGIGGVTAAGGPASDGYLDPATITPVQSMFASSKALWGGGQLFDLTTAIPETLEYLESYVAAAMEASPIQWIRASATVDTSNPGVDLWTASWAAPISPFWRQGGTKGSNSKGPSVVKFNYFGLSVLRPQVSTSGGNTTLTWYNVGPAAAASVRSQIKSEPSVSLDFHMVGADGNHKTQSFKQTFANSVWPMNTRDGLYFPSELTLETDLALVEQGHVDGISDEVKVANKTTGAMYFTYRDPNGKVNHGSRPLYQGVPIQSTGGHISWNNNYYAGGSFATEVKVTPIYSHNLVRIWKIEAVFS